MRIPNLSVSNLAEIEKGAKKLVDAMRKGEVLPGTGAVLLTELADYLPDQVWSEAIKNEEKRGKDLEKDIANQTKRKTEAIKEAKEDLSER